MLRAGGHGSFVHLPTVLGRKQADEAKLRYWGLIEEELKLREDGGRAGWWRVTDAGALWARGLSAVPRYAVIFDSKLLRLEGPPLTIVEALGNRFNYRDLMDGRA